VLFGAFQGAFSASLDLYLDTTGTSSHTNFDSGPAYTNAWHGDIIYLGDKIGVFNAFYTSQDSGTDYCLTRYDLVIPWGESIPAFASILVSNTPGAASLVENPNALPRDDIPRVVLRPTLQSRGTVFAASPVLSSYVGTTAELWQPASVSVVKPSPYFRIYY